MELDDITDSTDTSDNNEMAAFAAPAPGPASAMPQVDVGVARAEMMAETVRLSQAFPGKSITPFGNSESDGQGELSQESLNNLLQSFQLPNHSKQHFDVSGGNSTPIGLQERRVASNLADNSIVSQLAMASGLISDTQGASANSSPPLHGQDTSGPQLPPRQHVLLAPKPTPRASGINMACNGEASYVSPTTLLPSVSHPSCFLQPQQQQQQQLFLQLQQKQQQQQQQLFLQQHQQQQLFLQELMLAQRIQQQPTQERTTSSFSPIMSLKTRNRNESVDPVSVCNPSQQLHPCGSTQPLPDPPGEMDVLFGRGRHHRDNPGNRRMQLLVDVYRDAYYVADRDEKTTITKTIVKLIKQQGRFLKLNKGTDEWLEVSDEAARHKVGHAMRDGRDRPNGPVDPNEVKDIPIISEEVRRSLDRMLAFNVKGNKKGTTFAQDEVDILSRLFASSSPEDSEVGTDDSDDRKLPSNS